jgi:peptidoglycan hydrolase CwlO-like protein
LRRELHDANMRLKDKDHKINELMKNQKSIDLDLHNLTEQLFQQAYKLVNDEKKRMAELKIRVEMLEAENTELKSTVKVHKRPAFSHHMLSPSSLMTPVKLTKTPFRTLLSRYTNSNSYADSRTEKVTLMEPLCEEESSADPKLVEQLLSVQTENKDLNVLLVEFEKRIRQIKDENRELKEQLNVKDKEVCELVKSRDDALEKCTKVESIIDSLSQ